MTHDSKAAQPIAETLFSVNLTEKQSRNFWRKIDRGEEPDYCWWWNGSTTRDGYGTFRLGSKIVKAHRVSYALHIGAFPSNKLICHRCDNPRCVNPMHLWIGTDGDNALDRNNKGRGVVCVPRSEEPHSGAKLTVSQAEEIRKLYLSGAYTQKEIGEMFSICQPVVSRVYRRLR